MFRWTYIEKIRHIIVHNGGVIYDIENFKKIFNLDRNPQIRKLNFFNKFINENRVCLCELDRRQKLNSGLLITLVDILKDIGVLIYAETIVDMGFTPFWERIV